MSSSEQDNGTDPNPADEITIRFSWEALDAAGTILHKMRGYGVDLVGKDGVVITSGLLAGFDRDGARIGKYPDPTLVPWEEIGHVYVY